MNNNILPILTILVLCYVLFCQNQNKEKFSQQDSNVKITEALKNLGLIANRIITSDSIDIPVGLNDSGGQNIYINNSLKLNDSIYLYNNDYCPEGIIVPYFSESLLSVEISGENKKKIKYNLPSDRWVICDGHWYLKYKYHKSGNPLKLANIDDNLKEYYLFAPNMSNKIVLGASIPERNIETNDIDFGYYSTNANPYYDSNIPKIHETIGNQDNKILLEHDNIPNHYHHFVRRSSSSCYQESCKFKNITSVGNLGKVGYILTSVTYDEIKNNNWSGIKVNELTREPIKMYGQTSKTIRSENYKDKHKPIDIPINHSKLIYIMKI